MRCFFKAGSREIDQPSVLWAPAWSIFILRPFRRAFHDKTARGATRLAGDVSLKNLTGRPGSSLPAFSQYFVSASCAPPPVGPNEEAPPELGAAVPLARGAAPSAAARRGAIAGVQEHANFKFGVRERNDARPFPVKSHSNFCRCKFLTQISIL